MANDEIKICLSCKHWLTRMELDGEGLNTEDGECQISLLPTSEDDTCNKWEKWNTKNIKNSPVGP